ncbi:hypothetical protein CA984_13880 [Streptosporangium minutum]|uniref:Uncharacterized protein n=1 Tax=Streptosporangium minutum TaxID=569862 RepID=A0A243RPE8_9ACTN|nr:hypothetical protein CA984_13880 [Streptosporangium minutum]
MEDMGAIIVGHFPMASGIGSPPHGHIHHQKGAGPGQPVRAPAMRQRGQSERGQGVCCSAR